MDNRPIGLFDSGIGGISILDKLKELLPNENFIFLADNKNCPYGYRSKKEIISLSTKNCEKLEIARIIFPASTTNDFDFSKNETRWNF